MKNVIREIISFPQKPYIKQTLKKLLGNPKDKPYSSEMSRIYEVTCNEWDGKYYDKYQRANKTHCCY